MQMVAEQYLAY